MRWTIRRTGALVALSAGAIALSAAGWPRPDGTATGAARNGRLAFLACRPTGTHCPARLYAFDVSSGAVRDYRLRLEGGDADASGLAWSPDGRRLALGLTTGAGRQLVVRDRWNRVRRRVVASDADHPTWSPDGRRLAFTQITDAGDAGVRETIAVVDATGRNLRLLRAGSHPSWSPTDRIAFSGPRGLFTMRPDGTGVRRIVASAHADGPRWSPDGARIAFEARSDVWVARASGRSPRRLAAGGDPAWSPDGALIAFVPPATGGSCGPRLGLVRPDGGGRREIRIRGLGGARCPSDLAWQPRAR